MAHRSYDSILPAANKLLTKKWDDTRFNAHRKAVKQAKSATDSKAPPTYVHMHIKMKKLQLEEERLAQIQHDNRLLLEKMSSIMRGRSQVDHLNDYAHKSLNKEKRQRDLLTITQENQDILKRIQAKKPAYNHTSWESDFKQSVDFKKAITRYPLGASPSKHQSSLDDTTFGEDEEEDIHSDHKSHDEEEGAGTEYDSKAVEGAHTEETSTDAGVQLADDQLQAESTTDPTHAQLAGGHSDDTAA